MWAWKERYGGIILGQLQRLGISADWTRTRFTLDEGLSKAVRKQFVELYHRGLVYRGERIVNWDPESRTTLSDLEVDREDRPGKMYTLAYALETGGSIHIATVRPETIFADVAVAVHPDDARFTHLHGQKARIPLTERWVPVITDAAVEPDFGTGALKITPAHDPTDFEIGARHDLPRPSVIDLDAKLVGEGVPEAFRGLDRFEARSAVMGALVDSGELIGAEDYTIPVGLSQRTKVPVEPILSTQWFFKMDAVAPQVLAALDAGADLVVGSRRVSGGDSAGLASPLRQKLSSAGINLARAVTGSSPGRSGGATSSRRGRTRRATAAGLITRPPTATRPTTRATRACRSPKTRTCSTRGSRATSGPSRRSAGRTSTTRFSKSSSQPRS